MDKSGGKVRFFPKPADWRKWLERNHDKERELWVGFYKKGTGKPSITWPESVDQALCFGWIDGLRKGIDDESYRIRFTPRKPRSIWSRINIGRVAELTKLGLMRESGLKAFQLRDEKRSAIYTYERASLKLDEAYEKKFKANKKAWKYFQSRPPWYQRTTGRWVMSAKKEETRWKRLETLIKDSAENRVIGPLLRSAGKK